MKIVVLPTGIIAGDALDEVQKVMTRATIVRAEKLDEIAAAILAVAGTKTKRTKFEIEIVAHGSTGFQHVDAGTAPNAAIPSSQYELKRSSAATDQIFTDLAASLSGRITKVRLCGCKVGAADSESRADDCTSFVDSGPCLLLHIATLIAGKVKVMAPPCAIAAGAFNTKGFNPKYDKFLVTMEPTSTVTLIQSSTYQSCEQSSMTRGVSLKTPVEIDGLIVSVERLRTLVDRMLPFWMGVSLGDTPILDRRAYDARGLLSIPVKTWDGLTLGRTAVTLRLVMEGEWFAVDAGGVKLAFPILPAAQKLISRLI